MSLSRTNGALPASDADWQPSAHLSELLRMASSGTRSSSLLQKSRQSVPISLFRYLARSVENYIGTLVLSPATVLLDPLSTLVTLIIYPVIFMGLFLITGRFFEPRDSPAFAPILFWAGSHLGGNELAIWAGRKWAHGYSAPNWLDPTIFGPHSTSVINSALPLLSGAPTTIPHPFHPSHSTTTVPPTTRLFSLPLARTFLLFSSIVYERSDPLVIQAVALASRGPAFRRDADRLLEESEEPIRRQARDVWDLCYEGISDLSSTGGPFASCFYPRRGSGSPWIALVFKGTSVDNFAEILVDASITRTPADVLFGAGTAHEGFYSELFPQNTGGNDGCTIRSHLISLAARMRAENPSSNGRIPLWVTGHSLGSALAALCYARFLRQPGDLGEDLELRDSYCFGTPRMGDGAWAGKFEESIISPYDRPNVLWRVVNHLDVVCQVPPGLADDSAGRAVLGLSVLNYAHIGTEVLLNPIMKPFYSIQTGYFRSPTEAVIEDSAPAHGRGKGPSSRLESLENAGWNPLRFAITLLPAPAYDHFPAAYLDHLNLIDANATSLRHKEKSEDRVRSNVGTSQDWNA